MNTEINGILNVHLFQYENSGLLINGGELNIGMSDYPDSFLEDATFSITNGSMNMFSNMTMVLYEPTYFVSSSITNEKEAFEIQGEVKLVDMELTCKSYCHLYKSNVNASGSMFKILNGEMEMNKSNMTFVDHTILQISGRFSMYTTLIMKYFEWIAQVSYSMIDGSLRLFNGVIIGDGESVWESSYSSIDMTDITVINATLNWIESGVDIIGELHLEGSVLNMKNAKIESEHSHVSLVSSTIVIDNALFTNNAVNLNIVNGTMRILNSHLDWHNADFMLYGSEIIAVESSLNLTQDNIILSDTYVLVYDGTFRIHNSINFKLDNVVIHQNYSHLGFRNSQGNISNSMFKIFINSYQH
eukprot:TRINITY_DN3676_c0_g1_i1.p1 TRINITY_DN3676_c0_g1~~TRINITY_DN3676_c0_g1_i1.p1  ORF type:complete len:358 (+),score=64.62 TRINITY_DN3676_c0_g1_i1:166-1239(+)